jgi:TetR/AcrR family transcriptional repressor of mexJK operon
MSVQARCDSHRPARAPSLGPSPTTGDAEHCTFLVVGRPIDQAVFDGAGVVLADLDVDSYARAGVRVFLAAYRPTTPV